MHSFLQLLRRPLKAVLGLLLVGLAAAVFVTCIGQYISVGRFRQTVEESYSTVACPTKNANKAPGGGFYLNMNPDLWELIQDQAAREDGLVKALSEIRLYTAHLPEVTPLNYSAHWNADHHTYDHSGSSRGGDMLRGVPYTGAMLAVRLTGMDPQLESEWGQTVGAPSEEDEGGWITYPQPTPVILHCEGVVEQVVALEEGFRDPTGCRIELNVVVWDEEELAGLGLEVGQTYMVYGRNYRDLDYELRTRVSVDQQNFEQPFSMDKVKDRGSYWTDPQGNSRPLYSYENTEGNLPDEGGPGGKWQSFSPEELAWVNACSLTVCDRIALPLTLVELNERNIAIGWKVDRERRLFFTSIEHAFTIASDSRKEESAAVDAAQVVESYHVPTIAPLTGSVEEFLADPAHGDWAQTLEDTAIDHHAFPLLAVDKVGYQGDFARQQVRMVEGRDFTPQEQAEGSRVCVISQSLAAANGLSIGDQITLQSYSYDFNIYENERSILLSMHDYTLPTGAFYSHTQGFHGEPEQYTIVGLYRQDNEWHNGDSAYGFLPNTVFVPTGAVSGDYFTLNYGMYLSIVLENGRQKEFQALLKEAGFSGCFSYYDQGYSKIVKELDSYEETVSKAAYIGVAAFAAMLGLFLFLYPGSSGPTVRTMHTLGAGRRRALGHVIASTLYLLVPGILLGGVLGSVLWERFTAELMKASATQLAIQADIPALVVPLAGGLLLAGASLTVLTALLATAVDPMKRK